MEKVLGSNFSLLKAPLLVLEMSIFNANFPLIHCMLLILFILGVYFAEARKLVHIVPLEYRLLILREALNAQVILWKRCGWFFLKQSSRNGNVNLARGRGSCRNWSKESFLLVLFFLKYELLTERVSCFLCNDPLTLINLFISAWLSWCIYSRDACENALLEHRFLDVSDDIDEVEEAVTEHSKQLELLKEVFSKAAEPDTPTEVRAPCLRVSLLMTAYRCLLLIDWWCTPNLIPGISGSRLLVL